MGTLPAFLAPIAFVLTGPGEYLLGRGPWWLVLGAALVGALGILALAEAAGGWLLGLGPAAPVERALAGLAGLALLYLHPVSIGAGVVLLTAAGLLNRWRARTRRPVIAGSAAEAPGPAPAVPGSVADAPGPASGPDGRVQR